MTSLPLLPHRQPRARQAGRKPRRARTNCGWSRMGTKRARAAVKSGGDGPAAKGSEALVKLVGLKDRNALSREEAAARLRASADELVSGNDVVIEREDMRFVARVPDQVNLKVEFEVEDDGTELEIELTW